MNIGNVSIATATQKAPEQKPAPRQVATVAGAVKSAANMVTSAAQEATETAAQTRREATGGDQQAVRKMAHDAAARSGIGGSINTKA